MSKESKGIAFGKDIKAISNGKTYFYGWTGDDIKKYIINPEIEKLEADKKLLLETVEFYAYCSTSDYAGDYGKRANECLEKLNGRVNINEKVEQS